MSNNIQNIVLATDSYKLVHHNMYPKGTQTVYSYFESRNGAEFPFTTFFGLQYLLEKYIAGEIVTTGQIAEAKLIAKYHFGNEKYFNENGWKHIIDAHWGRLPLLIKAVPEGTSIPTNNVLMTVENTCPSCYWLTNAVESLLTHVWYSSTIATLSRYTKQIIKGYLDKSSDNPAAINFMLHDFGYRGASSQESAEIGGAGHLVNFLGTDTLPAMLCANRYYKADYETLAYSVAATEHSIMTAMGPTGEKGVVRQLLQDYPTGILSVVSDSFNIYNFVEMLGTEFKQAIIEREGVFVVRPDSVTKLHSTPEDLTLYILVLLDKYFGSTFNSKGYKVLDPHVRVIWGDGIDYKGIEKILKLATNAKFSAENLVFGMGGGLLQRHNRDTQRFAFKSSAQKRDGIWHDVYKDPIDSTKASKRGRLMLSKVNGEYKTELEGTYANLREPQADQLVPVFENGNIVKSYTFAEVRENAQL